MPSIIYLWNRAPFIRLLLALTTGILLQWHLQFSLNVLLICISICGTAIFIYSFFPLTLKYSHGATNGLIINIAMIVAGAILVWAKDIRHDKDWLGHQYKKNEYVMVTLQEPLVEKAASYKALGRVEFISVNDSCKKASGQIILYFKKDSSGNRLHYGSQIIFRKPLQEIKNAGNPGSFDYKRYSLFQGITHQVYLSAGDFEVLPTENKNLFTAFIFNCRQWVITTLRQTIHGEKEQGLAEALLIGYKDDLDKNLVQSYSNTGVVHVIAISGLHLGLIYWLLLMLTKPLKKIKKFSWPRLLIVVSSLWLFSILAGGQPSVLRSAVMFTCIALGEVIYRKTSIYNTLTLSAFVLLCINPFWLWDVGFQLSYAAVLSIIVFFRPVYNWFYFANKAVDFLWKLNAVTIAAQLLTLPISVYHFHQIPTLFLLTNVVAVPLSSLILIGEIVLCVLFFIEPLADFLGNSLKWLIYFMNSYIERLDGVSFSTWNGLSLNIIQTTLLLIVVITFCYWLMEKKRIFLWLFTTSTLLFLSLHSASLVNSYQQKKLIVYNVPKHQAIDLIVANTYTFIGDSSILLDAFIRNFHIQPSRILHNVTSFQAIFSNTKDFDFSSIHISIVDTTIRFLPQQQKRKIDLLILSKNPKLYIGTLIKSFSISQIVIDGSVPAWKAALWKRDCDSLHIPCYDVSQNGAFVMNL